MTGFGLKLIRIGRIADSLNADLAENELLQIIRYYCLDLIYFSYLIYNSCLIYRNSSRGLFYKTDEY